MWLLCAVVAFLIVIFSTSQILAYIVCFLRYPELMEDMPTKNKKLICVGLILHSCINIVWIILICLIETIKQNYLSIIISSVIALIISIFGVCEDPNLYKNFKQLTGVDKREKVEEELINYINNLKKNLPNNMIKNNQGESVLLDLSDDNFNKSISQKEDPYSFEGVDITNIYKKPELKALIEEEIRDDETLNFPEEKRIKFEKMFNKSFKDVLYTKDISICGKKSTIYSFSPISQDFGNIGSFICFAEVGRKETRYFTLEVSYDAVFFLCEWEFLNDGRHKHTLYCSLINGLYDIVNSESFIEERFINKIKQIIKAEKK